MRRIERRRKPLGEDDVLRAVVCDYVGPAECAVMLKLATLPRSRRERDWWRATPGRGRRIPEKPKKNAIFFFFSFFPRLFLRHNGPASAAPCQEGHFWKRSETKKRILRVAQKTQIRAALQELLESLPCFDAIRSKKSLRCKKYRRRY